MQCFCLAAYAKINWTLDILGTRPDEYHLMDMLMQTVSLCDLLWMEEAEDLTLEAVPGGTERAARSKDERRSFLGRGCAMTSPIWSTGRPCFCVSAAACAGEPVFSSRNAFRRVAGMGGGSADCAAALKGLNALWGAGPFACGAAVSGPGTGCGRALPDHGRTGARRRHRRTHPAPSCLRRRCGWCLVQPCEGLSTREVFSVFDRMDASSLRHPDNAAAQDALLRRDLTALAPAMANVLQAVSESARPALAQAVRALEAAGAARAMMTGQRVGGLRGV